jgi:uridine kinase
MVIFISGPLNSGKSTTASELKRLLKKSVILEPDTLRTFIAEMPIDEAIPIVLEMTIAVIEALEKKKLYVIIPYPISKQNHQLFIDRLHGIRKYFFVLNPKKDAIKNGRGKRKLIKWEKQRILRHYKTGIHNPGFGFEIDNTRKRQKEVAKLILTHIET